MDYEKKYKEAQKWIESIYSELSHEQQMEAEAVFSELKENEDVDEKIREEIIATIHLYYGKPLEDEAKEMIAWLEKQGEKDKDVRCKYLDELLYSDDIYQMAMNDAMVEEAKKKAIEALSKLEISKLLGLEKQGEQPKEATYTREVETGNGNIKALVTGKVQLPKFKVKYAGSEYNVLEIKEIAGVTYYGIEDEPNHIDYVLPENCEIISGYGEKEKGNPYPTKLAIFSGQNLAWSEEDEQMLNHIICDIESLKEQVFCKTLCDKEIDWLKSLRPQKQWKPSEEQIKILNEILSFAANHESPYWNDYIFGTLNNLIRQLKKLTE